MPRIPCECCGVRGTPKKFRKLNPDQLRVVNQKRVERNQDPLPPGVKVRSACSLHALALLEGTTHLSRSIADSSASEDESTATEM